MKIKQLTCALLLAFGLAANAANTVTKVGQVTGEVTLSENVDYVIQGTTPFADGAKVNITNTDHAVLIIQSIRPSHVLSQKLLDGHVFVNGEQAVNGENCQVRMYAHGSIVFPYAKDIKPLTVYSEQNYGGTAVNDFGLEHSSGFMNTLTEAKLNNQIRSFKLKRGYMVTFAVGKSGWGYSRCFIADTEDLEFAELPAHLDARISSYRVFQWYDSQKKGLANDTRAFLPELLEITTCYSFGPGENRLPDMECIPHRIHEGWPSPSECGSKTYSCHLKTNNEPGNSADPDPATVEQVLNNWQELMRTGMRLCSESSHDGSWSHLDQFIAEVDKRGWRCDILDLHCYWASGFGNMEHYYNKYGKRPIWITEWVWGASWNNNGIFSDRSKWDDFSESTQQKNLNEVRNILTTLNNSPYVERYFYWNSERDCSKLFRGEGEMSLTGNYYRDMKSGMAYRKEYEKVPNVVYTAPSNLAGAWSNQTAGSFRLTWSDTNGDMLSEIQLQRKGENDADFVTVQTIAPKDMTGKTLNYACNDTLTEPGVYEYRVVNVAADNAKRYSAVVKAAKSSVQGTDKIQFGEIFLVSTGDEVDIDYTGSFASAPAVFMGPMSNFNTKMQLGNLISASGSKNFTYKPLPWVTSESTDFAKIESLPFMAIEEGNHTFGTLDCEVGVAKVNMIDTVDVVFTKPFAEGVVPVVLTEIRKPMLKENPIIVKVRNVTNTGFKCILMYEDEVGSKSAMKMNVCYLAITPGVGVLDDNLGLMIAAGTSEATMYGSSARPHYFVSGGDTLRCLAPSIFAALQTSNYDAATLVRRQSSTITEEVDGVEYTVGARFRRVVDSSRSNASDGTKLSATSMKDDLGWVVLYTRGDGLSVEQMEADAEAPLRPYVVGNTICVDGYEDFDVYTMHGIKLASANALAPGVYVVKAGNATAMVVVK